MHHETAIEMPSRVNAFNEEKTADYTLLQDYAVDICTINLCLYSLPLQKVFTFSSLICITLALLFLAYAFLL